MFAGPLFQSYYNDIPRITRELLDKEEASYLLIVDFDEELAYLVVQIRWEPLEWDEGAMTVERFTVKRPQRDHFDRQRVYQVEEQMIRIRIPISPHPQRRDYFNFGPSTTRGIEPDWKFEGDVLIHEVEATENAVKAGVEAVAFWLGNRNKDIEAGNNGLTDKVRQVWTVKREQLEKSFGEADALLIKINIPLYQDPNAPVKPIEIKPRQLRTVMEKPLAATASEPSLSEDDVKGLVDFIEQYARQFEVTPEAYADMEEERLRDLLVGMMNVNYPGSTTGETFNKLGKTDISLRVDSGHVLICECKFWSGAKGYGLALDQIFGYLTWRQNYGVLIHFSKLKDMSRAMSEALRSTEDHESFQADSLYRVAETRFTSRHFHPQDLDKSLEVSHLFLDLSI